jgi:hypothetical protein
VPRFRLRFKNPEIGRAGIAVTSAFASNRSKLPFVLAVFHALAVSACSVAPSAELRQLAAYARLVGIISAIELAEEDRADYVGGQCWNSAVKTEVYQNSQGVATTRRTPLPEKRSECEKLKLPVVSQEIVGFRNLQIKIIFKGESKIRCDSLQEKFYEFFSDRPLISENKFRDHYATMLRADPNFTKRMSVEKQNRELVSVQCTTSL